MNISDMSWADIASYAWLTFMGVLLVAAYEEVKAGGLRDMLRHIANKCPARIITTGNRAYLWRYFLGEWRRFGITFYLHEFSAEDAERWLHNHPFKASLGIVLLGGYLEERLQYLEPAGPHVRLNKVRMLNWISERDFHRITKPQPGTWTLFICFRRAHDWGFIEPASSGEYLPRDYPKDETFSGVPFTNGIVFHNPYTGKEKGGERWWEGAPTGRELRDQYFRRQARTRYGERVEG